MSNKSHFSSFFFSPDGQEKKIPSFCDLQIDRISEQANKDGIDPKRYSIRKFGSRFILNPHQIPNDFNLLIQFTKDNLIKKVDQYMKNNLGFLSQFKLKTRKKTQIRILSRVDLLKKRISKQKAKFKTRYQIANLKFFNNKIYNNILFL